MIGLAGIFGAVSGAIGTFISFLAPRMPTGPWMVSAVTGIFVISLVAAPRRGMLARLALHWKNRQKTAEENILTTLYRPGERQDALTANSPVHKLAAVRAMSELRAGRVLRRLEDRGLVLPAASAGPAGNRTWRLTRNGIERAQRLIRLHRLWEIYLTERLHLPSDHVHGDAEDVEHLITPEIEVELERILNHPERDPHGRPIPYAPASPAEELEPRR